ncbi:MAG: caspase family protein [Polyangiaceae bacterium]
MKAWIGGAVLLAGLGLCRGAHAEPVRILIAASHARGAPGELPLRHAAEDAENVARALTALGDFAPSAALVLGDPTLAELDAAFERARAIAASHVPGEVTLLFYFSGHGDRDRIHLGDETVAMTDVAARARSVPAGLRVLVTDACRTYPSRFKGVSTEPGFAIATSPTSADGVVWLFASGEGEPAQESDELEGALFTHYWVSSLRGAGDANGDGQVTLAESYDFAYSQTLLRSSRSTGVLQHPSAVFDLREAAPIVLTRTFATGTVLRLPRTVDAHYLVYSLGSRTVLGELWGSADREVAFALPPGRYLVQRRSAAGSGALDVALAEGQSRSLASSDFRPVREEQLAAKGGAVVVRPNELGVEVDGVATRLAAYGGQVTVRYAHRWDDWSASLGVGAGYAGENTSAERVKVDAAGADAFLERRFSFGETSVGAGAGAEADVFWQSLQRTDAARVAAAGYPTTQSFTGLAAGPVVRVDLRWNVTTRSWLELSGRGGALFANLEGSMGALWTARVGLGAGFGF